MCTVQVMCKPTIVVFVAVTYVAPRPFISLSPSIRKKETKKLENARGNCFCGASQCRNQMELLVTERVKWGVKPLLAMFRADCAAPWRR